MKENNIDFDRYQFGEVKGSCMWMGDNAYVGVIGGLSRIEEREVIAHELGHLLDGTDKVMGILIAERRAEKIGREFLIPKDKLIRAIEENDSTCDTQCLAQLFGVSMGMMQERIRDIFNM